MSNKTFLCIQRSEPCNNDAKKEVPSAAQMEQMYAKFNAWKDKYQDNILDMGGQLGAGAVVRSDGAIDGPFAQSKEIVGGYMIVTAANIEQAIAVAQESPGVFPGASVEVREIKKN